MPNMPLLTFTLFSPLIGMLFLAMVRGNTDVDARNARHVALGSTLMTLILSLLVWEKFDPQLEGLQFIETFSWVPGVRYVVGIDGLSMVFILLTTFLMPIAVLASWRAPQTRVTLYMMAFLALQVFLLGAFVALDLVLFYIFFEGSLLPLIFIIGLWGGVRRIAATFKFFLFTLFGSIFFLLAIIYFHGVWGTTDFATLQTIGFTEREGVWLFLAFLIAGAVKMAVLPVHTWLPDAHVEAPTAGSMILAGILLKLGGYALVRFALPLFPEASHMVAPWMWGVGLVGVLYASLVALVQKDMKKLVAYSSISHMSLVLIGIFSFNLFGLTGAIFQMLAHGLSSAALFLCVGILYDRTKTRLLASYSGIARTLPFLGTCFVFFALAALALPGTGNFIGEFLIFVGAWMVQPWVAAVAVSAVVLSAAYSLWLVRQVVWGAPHEVLEVRLAPLSFPEKSALGLLVGGILLLGLYPQPIIDTIQNTDLAIRWAPAEDTSCFIVIPREEGAP